MKQGSSGSLLSTVFVDYDNIYLSLKRKSEDAAKKFAKNSASWLSAIESGALLTTTNGRPLEAKRRLVLSRCYGNPVPRRNSRDNTTDMNSFPFVRHHFLRSGFEVVDCPPLTAQLKNSADIRMVMDVRDLLTHDTYFDEFIILSGDADFTPVLHRLRAHARRTVIFANDYTAAPYTAICDGEIREADLVRLLTEDKLPGQSVEPAHEEQVKSESAIAEFRREILEEVTGTARAAGQPIPLESLGPDRAVRTLGHHKTVGSSWGGAGSFRELLATHLSGDIRLSEQPPYFVYDASRDSAAQQAAAATRTRSPMPQNETGNIPPEPILPMSDLEPAQASVTITSPQQTQIDLAHNKVAPTSANLNQNQHASASSATDVPDMLTNTSTPTVSESVMVSAPGGQVGNTPTRAIGQTPEQPYTQQVSPHHTSTMATPSAGRIGQAGVNKVGEPTEIQKSIARIHDACQAPPLSPPEYRVMFDVVAQEISNKGLRGTQTLESIAARMAENRIDVRIDDVRFILDVVSETDPWLEQGSSAHLFASRFRNFVVARCRSQGLSLTADEIDLIDAWFLDPIQSGAPQDRQSQTSHSAAAGTLGQRAPMESTHQYAEAGVPARSASQPVEVPTSIATGQDFQKLTPAARTQTVGRHGADQLPEPATSFDPSQRTASPSIKNAYVREEVSVDNAAQQPRSGSYSPPISQATRASAQQTPRPEQQPADGEAVDGSGSGNRWWNAPLGKSARPKEGEASRESGYQDRFADNQADLDADEFPRIIRSQGRG